MEFKATGVVLRKGHRCYARALSPRGSTSAVHTCCGLGGAATGPGTVRTLCMREGMVAGGLSICSAGGGRVRYTIVPVRSIRMLGQAVRCGQVGGRNGNGTRRNAPAMGFFPGSQCTYENGPIGQRAWCFIPIPRQACLPEEEIKRLNGTIKTNPSKSFFLDLPPSAKVSRRGISSTLCS